ESVLKRHAGVRDAVVIVREDQPGDKRLVGYVVTEKNKSTTPEDLRSAVKEKLPDFMAPSAFVLLDALPMTPNGKVDRKALPAPEMERRIAGTEFIAPRNDIEEQLAGIWRE